MRINNYIILLFLVTLFFGCSGTRKIPEGDLLYVGHHIKVEGGNVSKKTTKKIKSTLNDLVRPKPNKSILGMRPGIFFYNLIGEVKKDKGFKHWVKYKLGEEPVLMSKVDLEYNRKMVQNHVENKGFFNAESKVDSIRNGKKAEANYEVNLHNQYRIKSVVFPKDSILLSKEIDMLKEKSVLMVGKPYDLDIIKSERTRIDAKLKERGFYYFNEDYILVQVDSTVANHEVDLLLKLKRDIPQKAKNQYSINNVFVYPNYNLKKDAISAKELDTIKYADFTIIENKTLFKPFIFDKTLLFDKDDLYNRTTHNLSLNRLITLGTFKFVKNEFKENMDSLRNQLDAYYYLTPLPKKSIQLEALAKTNSANYSGTELNINWSNRNTFRGAELLRVSAFAGLEVQVSGQNNGFNVYRFGGEANLIWPRFISPFEMSSGSAYVPNTKASISYEYQLRTKLYSLKTFNSSFGYLWKENERKEHNFKVINIAYTSSNNVSDLYKSQIEENPSLQKVIDKQFILGSTYSYTYTNTMLKNKTNNIYFKGEVDLSGNSVGLLLGANDGDNPKNILGVPFSQYSKLEMEFRHYYNFNKETTLASRIILGAGIPYGNSKELPFIKQFFIGGTSSIRAFRARSVGPGSFNGDNVTNSFLPDQSGDLKLELSTELRTKIYNIVKGAVFVDAGNIWLLNESLEKPGAQFSGEFLNELAVGAGVGLRFDFSFLVLRTDLAFPLRKPYLPEGNRWVMDDIKLSDSGWRKENLIFNLAIGYPF
ncbi:BamA/TamA family outer membrane protein [Mariniflexile sp. AS56]|uniref:translocation and assembly module lipoprotein TamL n=1 Tax=Mariniflexile sp. AS56 TaxID=3063957 RepID=UPI0026EAC93D|nr:BamA/TamA family outer membrane protein [Mariniflexile sp. AS56]MDO7172314.1 BamA/TamA family outer membrane protein [Mariniflexile sp. AS56]